TDLHPAAGRWRSNRVRPEPLWLPRSVIVVSTFIGPGWLPEQLGSLHKAGSRKMTQTNMTTAGIDTSKLKLDIAVHGRTERWKVANAFARLARPCGQSGQGRRHARRHRGDRWV